MKVESFWRNFTSPQKSLAVRSGAPIAGSKALNQEVLNFAITLASSICGVFKWRQFEPARANFVDSTFIC